MTDHIYDVSSRARLAGSYSYFNEQSKDSWEINNDRNKTGDTI